MNNAAPHSLPENVPTATILLDRPRTIAFTLSAMRRIRESGRTIGDETIDEAAMVDHIGAYVWAMLVNEDREGLTIEDVEDMLHPGNLPAVTAAFNTR
jgi:hypothetical protein